MDQVASRAIRRVGANICGKYRLLRVLGVGGMGTVYGARHRNGHPVAIKILHERWSETPDLERQFRREAQLANTVNHPGIVPVTDDDVSEDGCVFLVMPLLEGETLRARWERCGRKLPVDEVVAVGHAVLGVLGAAHAAKIVHRDIKPENIFLTRDGGVRVLDFGIARFFEVNDPVSATRSGRAVGTPAFMAPEQALGRSRDVDGRTDLWALGATMFSLLSGHFVHEAESASELVVFAATRPPRPLRDAAPDVPAALCDVVDRALAFTREARWGDAQEMDRALLLAWETALGKAVADLPLLTPPAAAAHDDVSDQPTRAPVPKDADDGPRTPTERLHGATTRTGAVVERAKHSAAASESNARAGSRLRSVLGGGAVLLMTVFFTVFALKSRHDPANAPAAPPSNVTPVIAHDAVRAFRAGLQAWSDGSLDIARQQFERATTTEPGYASAHLACAVVKLWPDDELRRHFQAAAQNRGELDAREASILDAYEPLAHIPPSFRATADRLQSVVDRYPDDPFATVSLAAVMIKIDRLDAAIRLLNSALPKWPHLAVAQLQLGIANALAGRVGDAQRAFRDCIASSPSAMTCLADLARLDANEGECREAEDIARRELSVDSKSMNGYDDLARALFANGQPIETVALALEREWMVAPDEESREMGRLSALTTVSILRGDFDAALDATRKTSEAVAARVDENSHAAPMELTIRLEMELGRQQEADLVAAEFLAHEKTWLPDSYFDFTTSTLALRHRLGTTDYASFSQVRKARLAQNREEEKLVGRDSLRWLLAYATSVTNAAEAIDAIGAIPAEGVPDPLSSDSESDEEIGRMYLLAGRPEQALPFLRRSTNSCSATSTPITATQAHLLLGEALERTGDPSGACAAYQTMIKRWGHERRSTSARSALSRAKALACHNTTDL